MFCASCGTVLTPGMNFCSICGRPNVSQSAQPSQPLQYEICSVRKSTQTVKAGLWDYKNFTKTILYLEAEGPYGKYIVGEPASTEQVEIFDQSSDYNSSKTNRIKGDSINSIIDNFHRQLLRDGWQQITESNTWRRIVTYTQLPSSILSISDIHRILTEPYKPKGYGFAQLGFIFNIIKLLCVLAIIVAALYYFNK